MPSLVIERGQEKGFSFSLKPGQPAVIGRDPANQVIISDPASSRRHFQIRQDGGHWMISDLGSRNSTYVNEEKLETERPLAFGDRVQVGETVFSFLEEEQTAKGKAGGLAGKDIAGYKMLERVGRGGMGTVYKARQISLNRVVAFKILSTRYASDPVFVEKFVAEARAAAQLNHPNVVQVFDVGQAGGIHFFSMEFMEGSAVQDALSAAENSRLHWTEALPMVMDAARGLVFAERHGIVHRDIKPDNLMLTVENKVKIGDLGLAARADEVGDGKIFGTPHFIAPEQARGKDVSHPADIYSLGASLYRMVAGRTPFSGTTVKEILRAQINDPHVPLTEELEDFPPDLSAILDKMMQKKVEDRYQSAKDLVADLEAFQLEHQIELAGGRPKFGKGTMAAALLLILALASGLIWKAMQPPEKGDTKTIYLTDNTAPVNNGKTAAEKAADAKEKRDTAATIAFLKLGGTKPGKETDRAKEAEWLTFAEACDALAQKRKGTPAATDAAKLAASIRSTLKAQNDEYQATVGAAKTWWEGQKARIDSQMESADWTAVLKSARDVPRSDGAATNLAFVQDEADVYLAGLEPEVLKRARTSLDDALAAAQALLDAGKPSEALAGVATFETTMRAHAAANAELAALADSAKQWIEGEQDDLTAGLLTKLKNDRLRYAAAARSVRSLPVGEPTVFNWEFAECAAAFESAAEGLETWVYQDRAAARHDQLAAAGVGWERFLVALASGEIVSPKEALIGLPNQPPNSKTTLSASKPPTEVQFVVDVTIPAGTMSPSHKWKDLTPEMVWVVFLRERINKLSGDVALGLARVYVEVGHPSAAEALLERASEADAKMGPGEQVRLQDEVTALREYQALLHADGMAPDQAIATYKRWRDAHVYTEAYLFLDGRAGAELPPLLRQGKRDAYIASWGVQPVR